MSHAGVDAEGNIYDMSVENEASEYVDLRFLEKLGFLNIPQFVGTCMVYGIGRNRQLSMRETATPNEMLFLTELNDKQAVTDAIVISNYDYDGYLTKNRLIEIIRVLDIMVYESHIQAAKAERLRFFDEIVKLLRPSGIMSGEGEFLDGYNNCANEIGRLYEYSAQQLRAQIESEG